MIGLLILIAVAAPVLAGGMMGGGWPGMMGGYNWGSTGEAGVGGWFWGLGMGLAMLGQLAFWAVLAVAAVVLIRRALPRAGAGPSSPAAGEPGVILRRRYAAGEIDQATYERMKREIEA